MKYEPLIALEPPTILPRASGNGRPGSSSATNDQLFRWLLATHDSGGLALEHGDEILAAAR
jgi:hypothetical protein